jgi:hypothetical protein
VAYGHAFCCNGGAIIALLGSGSPTLGSNSAALGWFAGGLLLSILMGILSGIWGHRASVRIITARVKIDQSLLERALNEHVLADLAGERPTWKTWVPSYTSSASFLCLALGMLAIGGRL